MMHAPFTDLPIMFGAVSVRAGSVDILRDVTLSLSHGGPTVVLGPNGAGKSTLLRVAMGLAAPSAGIVTWGGRAQSGVERRAFVFQRPVMMRRTAAQNIAFALPGLDRVAKQKRIEKALARTGLTALADRPARRLSGGEQQRLAIARALAREPEVLFLDEPTSNLDPAAAKAIEAIIRDATLSGIKIVMATHDLGQARRIASEVIFLVGGALAEHGPSEKFFSQPATPQAAAFLRGDIVE